MGGARPGSCSFMGRGYSEGRGKRKAGPKRKTAAFGGKRRGLCSGSLPRGRSEAASLRIVRRRLSGLLGDLRLERRLHLVEVLDDALADHFEGLGIGLLHQAGQLVDIGNGALEGILGNARLLDQLVLGAAGASELLGDLLHLLGGLADELSL